MATELVPQAVDAETGEVLRERGHDFGELHADRLRPYIIDRQGTPVVQYAGLVLALHAVSDGYFGIETAIEQLPSPENGQTAVVSARVRIYDADRPDVVRREATGIGDANAGNVSKLMAGAVIRMAETRAKGRALRDLLNVRMVVAEELGPQGADEAEPVGGGAAPRPLPHGAPRTASFGGPVGPRPVAPAPRDPDAIEVDGRVFSREQVIAGKHRRIEQAQAAGLFVPALGAVGGPPPDDAPLAPQVEYSKELLRRLEARTGAARSSGK
jgi:hypothetical protein